MPKNHTWVHEAIRKVGADANRSADTHLRSVYHRAWLDRRRDVTGPGSRIEGIGRPRVEPSFVPAVIDEVIPADESVLSHADRARIALRTAQVNEHHAYAAELTGRCVPTGSRQRRSSRPRRSWRR